MTLNSQGVKLGHIDTPATVSICKQSGKKIMHYFNVTDLTDPKR